MVRGGIFCTSCTARDGFRLLSRRVRSGNIARPAKVMAAMPNIPSVAYLTHHLFPFIGSEHEHERHRNKRDEPIERVDEVERYRLLLPQDNSQKSGCYKSSPQRKR